MKEFCSFLNHLAPMTDSAIADIQANLQEKFFEKGEVLLEVGQTCKSLYFIEYGLVKMRFYKEDKQFIMRFFGEGSMLTGLDSYITGNPSQYGIVALEATKVGYLYKADLEQLCFLHPCLNTVLMHFFSMVSVNMMSRISEILEEDAFERYHSFLSIQGSLLQRISLGDLASYLGITQVSLSRIRAKR